MLVNKEKKSEPHFKPDKSYFSSLDNIEIFSETPKKEIDSPQQNNQDLIDLLLAYS
jgi:hypothetical protein